MSTIFASISSNFLKKSIPLYASTSINPFQFHTIPIAQYGPQTSSLASLRANDPTYLPGKSPPEVPTAPPSYNPGIPPEVPRRHNVPEFDPTPPETPGPGPEFPGPPDPIPPIPEAPRPPGEPARGPEITPPKPPEPGPSQPDIPPSIMGSNGLAFY